MLIFLLLTLALRWSLLEGEHDPQSGCLIIDEDLVAFDDVLKSLNIVLTMHISEVFMTVLET